MSFTLISSTSSLGRLFLTNTSGSKPLYLGGCNYKFKFWVSLAISPPYLRLDIIKYNK